MQSYYSRSSADHLRPLDLISDQVWKELKANGTFDRSQNPDTAHGKITRRVMRYEIVRQVMSYAENGQRTDGEISEAIVQDISFTYRTLRGTAPFRKFGETNARTPTVVRKEIKFPYP